MPSLIGANIIRHHEYSSKTRTERGRISSVTFRNIHVYAPKMPPSYLMGFDSEHEISNVTIDGLFLNGKKAESLEELNIYIKNVSGISLK